MWLQTTERGVPLLARIRLLRLSRTQPPRVVVFTTYGSTFTAGPSRCGRRLPFCGALKKSHCFIVFATVLPNNLRDRRRAFKFFSQELRFKRAGSTGLAAGDIFVARDGGGRAGSEDTAYCSRTYAYSTVSLTRGTRGMGAPLDGKTVFRNFWGHARDGIRINFSLRQNEWRWKEVLGSTIADAWSVEMVHRREAGSYPTEKRPMLPALFSLLCSHGGWVVVLRSRLSYILCANCEAVFAN